MVRVIDNIFDLNKSSTQEEQSNKQSTSNKTVLSLIGHSKSAEATYYQIPQLSTNIDMGFIEKKYMNQNPNTFLITHTHADHSFYMASAQPAFINRKESNLLYVPEECVKYVENFLFSCQELNANKDLERESIQERKPLKVIGVKPGDILQNIGRKENYFCKVFKCDHSVPCVGYAIYEKKKKLKKEYLNLKSKEIIELKKNKIEINEEVHEARIAICGDTTFKVFEENPFLLEDFSVIVIECTFLEEGQEEQALNACHIHFNHLVPFIEKYQNVTFILTHFSLRYNDEFILNFFKEKNYKNVVPFLDDPTK
ncbi:hypothetical protein ABK040_008454 [Willaertia magna]